MVTDVTYTYLVKTLSNRDSPSRIVFETNSYRTMVQGHHVTTDSESLPSCITDEWGPHPVCEIVTEVIVLPCLVIVTLGPPPVSSCVVLEEEIPIESHV